ncbi:MAG TPA: hypothetical protein VF983_16270 [Streptosporangiaceae bacterium]
MNIEIPLLVLKLGRLVKPRYLVLQHEIRGAGNNPAVVYADVFYSRSRAEKAAKAADDRLRFRIGDVVIGMNETSNIGSPCAS